MRVAIYPGSFDPVTYGHIDIIKRGANLFDKLIVAVLLNPAKRPLFSIQERIELLKEVTKDIPNVEVDYFDGLLVEYAKKVNASAIIKGLRMVSDFEYEFQMALVNKKLNPSVETIFLMTSPKYGYLSSSLVKEIAQFGGCLSEFVPDIVAERLMEKFKKS
ncbi:MAG: Phosphopantetheine adenylyltransferase [Caldanaerobacter subterraneus]|uniref:Phosphopantetheine adenylyltransferase n=3 Tax=Caldanaerobacter subterraneus TaxID=911092 RepID=COAD_CALS4|nr:pantetheine-phosphate adenylyltransferase [Caldanaerobacter subterraneus]Q8R9U9.1 RecName: Full=Phosphopantetheine adenylyltransferase; AltName: Full=Dephospho-CoA pyrophosphorylase; AltName: Full=Pantetheine-phosphate adenylyltransferase; Short=PPAT [Caldanaerobacter subterraneus subsp. tengcongensis MB4]AAM24705.1 Phosphopantetheine adenylyltransferase [Caldanaerobacter subterraneus subsp. tengcongensis MB4]KKC29552.1 phosphopantetheine adenylyltransferase [Caldanaerobacter subterraneus sub